MTDLELIKRFVPSDLQEQALKKLEENYPIQYIIGNVDFYNCEIIVNENVLIPRFETEYLVDKTIKFIKKLNLTHINILELGTGSGCISIALKKNLDANITAIDNSQKALEVAKRNALNNHVEIEYIHADILNFIPTKTMDIIISNPPYVPFNSPVAESIKYEPQEAIYAPNEGLFFYQEILKRYQNYLANDYLIAFEIGDKQGESIKKMVDELLPNSYVLVEKDYNNYDRYLFISNKDIFQ